MANELDNVEHKAKKLDKGKWLLVIIGVVTLIIIYRSYKASRSAGSPTSGTASSMPNLASGQIPQISQSGPTNPSSGSSMPDFSGLTQSLQSWEGFVSQLQGMQQMPAGTTSGTSPSYTSLIGEKLQGSGYTSPTDSAKTGSIITPTGTYYGIGTPGQLSAIEAAGQSFYVQTAPGVFTAEPNSYKPAAGTSIYTKG